jgi:uncharacterized protein (DUF58 family)
MAADYRDELRVLSKHHDIIACTIVDKREKELHPVGLIDFVDPETGEMVTVDTSSVALQEGFAENYRNHKNYLTNLFNKLKLDTLEIQTDRPFINEVRRLFALRKMRKNR